MTDIEKKFGAAKTSGYLVGDRRYLYPEAGDPCPPGGVKVHLLTKGGVCIEGHWKNGAGFLGWAALPARDKEKELKLKVKE